MQRLVYSPKAFVYVKNGQGQVLDLSRYVISGNVNRKINQVSTAEVQLRNPNLMWSVKPGDTRQVFTPMDAITIYLMRVKGKPIRVFTGFLDLVPYYEMYPGTITLSASCTLKKLLYTFFDPALPYTQDFLRQYGWYPEAGGSLINPNALSELLKDDKKDAQSKLTDGSIGNLLYLTLKDIGGWKSSDIFIEQLPPGIVERMQELYKQFDESNKLAKEEWTRLMHRIIGSASFGGGGGGGAGTPTGEVKGIENIIPVMVDSAKRHNIPAKMMIATWMIEWPGLKDSPGNPHYGWFQMQTAHAPYAYGPFSRRAPTLKETHDLGIASNAYAAAAAGWGNAQPSLRHNLRDWTMKTQGVNCGNNPLYCGGLFEKNLQQAEKLISKYGDGPSGKSNGPKTTHGEIIQMHGKARIPAHPNRPNAVSPKTNPTASNPVKPKIWAPIAGGTTAISSPFGEKNHGNPPHTHMGIDVPTPSGTKCVAPCDGKIGRFAQTSGFQEGGMIHFVFTEDVGDIKSGTIIGWGHVKTVFKHPGARVKGGETIALSNHPLPHVHFIQRTDDNDMDGQVDPTPLFKALQKGETTPTSGGSGGGGGGGDANLDELYSVAKATAFATELEWPSMEETIEAIGLQGQKSMMNDKPLMPFIQQLTNSSLRQFQSMPNGDFFGFYPDYFGEFYHRKPYWYIDDIEILDGRVQLSDESLATHVYVVGDTIPRTTDYINKLFSAGVINIFNIFGAKGVLNRDDPSQKGGIQRGNKPKTGGERSVDPFSAANQVDLTNHEDAVKFLQRYGARPLLQEEPFIRSPYFEAFMAYQQFMLLWSRQFLTTFTFTFMPELYPGGHVGFPDHGLQMYIDEVTHSWNYESGFVTQANLSAPAVLRTSDAPADGTPLPDNMMMALVQPPSSDEGK